MTPKEQQQAAIRAAVRRGEEVYIWPLDIPAIEYKPDADGLDFNCYRYGLKPRDEKFAHLTDEQLADAIREQVNLSRNSASGHDRIKTRYLVHEAKRRGWTIGNIP